MQDRARFRSSRAVAARVLAGVRRGGPPVIWGAEPMNGGNFLYLWATAWARRRHNGDNWLVRYRPNMEPWLAEYPRLGSLTIKESDIGWLQRRSVEWGQHAGIDFRFKDIRDFAREFILDSENLRLRLRRLPSDAIVVNVRRGDYYSNPEFRSILGFDIRAYVAAALDNIPSDGTRRIVVVSDDASWCASSLGDLLEARGDVAYMPRPHDMFDDFAQLVAGRHLILANSTFSYWGAYVASARPAPDRPRSVQAPLHFNRLYSDGESTLLLPEWRAIPEDEYKFSI